MPDAVLFDLDGTLINTEPLCQRVLAGMCAGLGTELTEEGYQRMVGKSWEAVIAAVSPGADAATRARITQETFALYDAEMENGVVEVPGGRALIRALHAHTRLGIVTGSTRRQLQIAVAQLGVGDVLQTTISEDDITRSKPDPQGYLLAMSRLGARAERTIIFEDSEAGIAAGKAAGCVVVAVGCTNHFHQDQSAADVHIQDLSDVDAAWCAALVHERG